MFFFLWKTYIADIGHEKVQQVLELSGLPDGIPSLPEYLAEYCSLSVSAVTQVSVFIYAQFGILYHLCGILV